MIWPKTVTICSRSQDLQSRGKKV
jgi:hypothetical protein